LIDQSKQNASTYKDNHSAGRNINSTINNSGAFTNKKLAVPKIAPAPSVSNNLVLIHVCDENKKVTQDFKCDRTLLLQHMKYFEKYLISD
jgi:hypothetical protein